MSTLEKRCLTSSAILHAGLVAVLVLFSALAARRVLEEPMALPPIELISLEGVRLTDGVGASGGDPASSPPVVRTETVTAPPVARPRPTPPVRVAPTPVPAPEPEPMVKPVKPVVQVSSRVVKSQDVDPKLKGRDEPVVKVRPVQVAKAPAAKSARELAAEKAAKQKAEEKEAAAAEQARQRAAQAASEKWKQAVTGIRSQLSRNLSGDTEISVPGPGGGGEVWMGYGSYLKAFYEARWRRPSSLSVPVAYVGISITIARDGRLVRFELVEKSGIRAMDDSVLEVIQRYRTLEPLPDGTSDVERTFRIKFKLEGIPQ